MINLGWLAMLVCTCTQIQYNNQIIFVNTSSVDNRGGGGGGGGGCCLKPCET